MNVNFSAAAQNGADEMVSIPVYDMDQTVKPVDAGAAAKAVEHSYRVVLSEAEWDILDGSISDIISMIIDAQNTFELVSQGVFSGMFDDIDPRVISIFNMVAKAIEAMQTKELEALGLLDVKLRCARASYQEAKRQAQLQGQEV